MKPPGRRTIVWMTAATLAAAGAIVAVPLLRPSAPPGIPTPDLSNSHRLVASKVTEARDRVLEEPRDAERWGELGLVLMAHQFRAEAVRAFDEAVRLDPGAFRWAYYLGYLKEETDLEEAVRWYERAAEIEPERFPVRLRLGNALLQLGRLDQAEGQFRLASKDGRASPYARLGLARVASARSDLPTARRHLEAAAKAPGWQPRPAYVELARVYRRLGDREAASRVEERARQLPETAAVEIPDPLLYEVEQWDALSRDFAQRADQASARGDLASAEQSYRILVFSRPDMPGPVLNLANVLLKQGRVPEAVDLLRTAVERFPDDVLARFRFASALDQAGEQEAAEAEYRRCISLKPDFAEAWYALGLLLNARRETEAARDAFAKAVEADGRHVRAHVALGLLLNEAGDREQALSMLRTAVKLAPDDPVPASYLRQLSEGAPSELPQPDAGS